jgi:putative hydrolase of the HAD superfamily
MKIQAAIFDMGGTIETYGYTRTIQLDGTSAIQQVLTQAGIDLRLEDEQLLDIISTGLKQYKQWSIETLVELPPARVWSEYIFRDLGVDIDCLTLIAEELSFLIETRFYCRDMRPEMPAVLKSIQDMGLKIGIISNVNSRGQVPINLANYGIKSYFDPVVLSSEYGRRKPDPSIFQYAAWLAKVPTSQCAYIGDRILRDILGARRAGYGLAVQIRHTFEHGEEDEGAEPDAVIDQMTELIDLLKEENKSSSSSAAFHARPVSAILFDAGDILYFRPNRGKQLTPFLQEFGLVIEAHHLIGKKALEFKAYRGLISPSQYHEALLRLYGLTREEDIERGMQVLKAEEDNVSFFEGVPETLAALKSAGFMLGIITDTAAPLSTKLEWFERGGFGNCWDSIVSSKEVGVRKPDPLIYEAALQQLGITAAQAVFVGHKAVELDGARALGIKTVAFNYEEDAAADYYIEKFSDLLSVPLIYINAGYNENAPAD